MTMPTKKVEHGTSFLFARSEHQRRKYNARYSPYINSESNPYKNMSERHYLNRATLLLEQQVAKTRKEIKEPRLSYLLDFVKWLKVNGRKDRTIWRRLIEARWLLNNMDVDAKAATKKDIEDLIYKISQARTEKNRPMAPITKERMKITVKLFYKYLYGDDEVPKIAKWIKPKTIPSSKTASDLLTDTEIVALLSAAKSPRDKCVISTMVSFGCRVGELLNLKYKDLSMTEDNGVFWITFDGKTGLRRVPFTKNSICYPYIRDYLDSYKPLSNNAPLFVTIYGDPLDYEHVRKLLSNLKRWTHIEKPLTSHLFRFTATTAMVKRRIPEAVIKRYMGWSPSSKELGRTYVKLSDENLADVVKDIDGIEPGVRTKNSTVKVCSCGTINPISLAFCSKCKKFLNSDSPLAKMQEMDMMRAEITDLKATLQKILESQGLRDEKSIKTALSNP